MQDGVGLLQQLRRLQGQQIGIARPGAHNVGDTGRRLVAPRRIEIAQHDTTRAGFVAGKGEAAPPALRPDDERTRGDAQARRSAH